MRHTSKNRNNRMRLQKNKKRLLREAKLARNARRAAGKTASKTG
jgi:hypothetical protein